MSKYYCIETHKQRYKESKMLMRRLGKLFKFPLWILYLDNLNISANYFSTENCQQLTISS